MNEEKNPMTDYITDVSSGSNTYDFDLYVSRQQIDKIVVDTNTLYEDIKKRLDTWPVSHSDLNEDVALFSNEQASHQLNLELERSPLKRAKIVRAVRWDRPRKSVNDTAIRKSAITSQSGSAAPPCSAEKLACFILPKPMRDEMLGDLEQEFQMLCQKFGEGYARKWYWGQVLRSVGPIVYYGIAKFAALAWLGKAAQWIMSKLGT